MFTKLSSLLAIVVCVLGFSSVQASENLKRVENQNVCMVTDMHFAKKQIPVSQNGKTYYGCCEMCKTTLAKDPKSRVALDPVSGKPVDKATAVIVAKDDNSVLYFENEKSLEQFKAKK